MKEITDTLTNITIGSLTLYSVLAILVLLIACFVIIKIVMSIIGRILDKSSMEQGVKGFVRSAAKWLLWIIAIIIIADRMGIETASFVALLSVAGLALSLSVQGLMTNLFSGITLLSLKPFVTGDYVDLDGASGTIKEVGMFYTMVSTIDNKSVYIPNGQVASAKIVNYTRQDKRRVDLTFCASYNDKTEKVKSALLSAVSGDARVLNEPAPPFVGLLSYKDSSIEYALRLWVKSDDYWGVYFSVNEKVREIFDAQGIEMTYEHLNVHIAKD